MYDFGKQKKMLKINSSVRDFILGLHWEKLCSSHFCLQPNGDKHQKHQCLFWKWPAVPCRQTLKCSWCLMSRHSDASSANSRRASRTVVWPRVWKPLCSHVDAPHRLRSPSRENQPWPPAAAPLGSVTVLLLRPAVSGLLPVMTVRDGDARSLLPGLGCL